MKQSSLLKFVSHTRDLSAPHDVSQTCNSPAPISAMHVQPLTLPPAGALPPTPLSHRASIEAAFDTSTWNWSQWTCPGWRQCFYDVMYERSLSASPLQPRRPSTTSRPSPPCPGWGSFLTRALLYAILHAFAPFSQCMTPSHCLPGAPLYSVSPQSTVPNHACPYPRIYSWGSTWGGSRLRTAPPTRNPRHT